MYESFVEWLQLHLGSTYQYSRGMWVDHAALNEAFICAIQSVGGPQIDVDDRRPRFRVILLGPRNGRQHAAAVQGHAEALIIATMESEPPCGAAHLQVISEVTGPGYTSENRAWCSLELQATH